MNDGPCFLIGSGGGIEVSLACGDPGEARRAGEYFASRHPGFTYRIGRLDPPPASGPDVGAEFRKALERASEIVAGWPEWKRGILGYSASPTVREPRQPINGDPC